MKRLTRLILILGMLGFLTPAAGQAQTVMYTPQPKAPAQPGKAFSGKRHPDKIRLSLVRLPEQWNDDISLKLTGTLEISNCARMGDMEYELKFTPPYLDIFVRGYRFDTDNGPEKPGQNCITQTKTPTAYIPLRMNELKERGIKKIRFESRSGLEYYDITIEDSAVRLTPANMKNAALYISPAYGQGLIDPLYRRFYPENTVIVYAPKGKKDEDLRAKIDNLARQSGLTPLEEKLANFQPPVAHPHYYYYIDGTSLHGEERPHLLGQIIVPEKIYGLHEDVWENKTLDIYVRAPKIYE